jgi:alpha-glucosidase
LLTRWTELATFQPIDRNHTNKGSGDKEVWVHGPEQEAIRRRYIEERYRLMPYLYTLVEELSRTGLPVVRPLFLEFPRATKDLQPLDLRAGNEFLFGPDLLVAPPPFPEQPEAYALKLPPGVWYDYWTGEKIQQPATQGDGTPAEPLIQPKLDVLPVYVREGSIIPFEPLVQSTDEKPQGPLTLRVYPGKDCHGSVYLDDGKTLAYTRGEFLRIEFSCAVTPSGVELHVGERKGKYLPWWKTLHLEVYDWQSPSAHVTLKQKPDKLSDSVDPARHVLTLELSDDPRGSDLEILRAN